MGALSMSAEVTAAIRQRAQQVRNDGVYIGLFEWLAFAAIAKQRVVMLFGSAPVDITAVYGCVVPDLQALEYHPLSFAVIACNADGTEAHYTTALNFRMNHYMLGVPSVGAAACEPGPFEGSPTDSPRSVYVAAFSAGYAVHESVAQGDCGVHVQALLRGWLGTPAEQTAMRRELAAKLEAVAEDLHWQCAWKACDEVRVCRGGADTAPVEEQNGDTTPSLEEHSDDEDEGFNSFESEESDEAGGGLDGGPEPREGEPALTATPRRHRGRLCEEERSPRDDGTGHDEQCGVVVRCAHDEPPSDAPSGTEPLGV